MKAIFFLILLTVLANADQIGIASWYSTKDGHKTASGRKLVNTELVAAHRTLKFGTKVRVINLKNHKSVIVTIIDRGPFAKGRIIDLTPAAFKQIGTIRQGICKVKLEIVK